MRRRATQLSKAPLRKAPPKKGSRRWKRAHPWRRRVRAARPGERPAPVLTLIHLHTGEHLAVSQRERVVQRLIDRFLRCRWTGRQIRMDPRPFRWVVAGAFQLGAQEVQVISGYRHPKFNRVLWKKGRQVARWSKHRLGLALDFRLVGVPLDQAYAYFRKRRLGGLGRYPQSQFLHLDTGPARFWEGR